MMPENKRITTDVMKLMMNDFKL
ncbi:hypothetical protein LIER_28760 [Lithospermum erythrorhizon]|uniref:Uncharacterized protein n=1 Tax=Lithospermum erythrorhizon TaxID=34254 RepID=A0AAV3RL31_LITER